MQRFQIEDNIGNIKTLAEQMVRKSLEVEINDLEKEKEKFQNNENDKKYSYIYSISSNDPYFITDQEKRGSNAEQIDLLRNNIESNLLPPNSNRLKKNSNQFSNNADISDPGKVNKDGSSNIVNTNANLNTNINTNLNTATNLNTNNNINTNHNINNNTNSNNNITNENEIYSEKNSKMNIIINENSSNITSIKSENKKAKKKENIIENKTSESGRGKEEDDIVVEIIDPKFLKKFDDDSSDDININIDINKKSKKSKSNKLTIYEREIKNLKRKNEKIEKKKNKIINDELRQLQPFPIIDPISEEIIKNNEIYIPIDKRAAKIHSMKISQRILNEANNKIRKMKQENEEISKYQNSKVFDQDEWDDFIERQYQWKDEIEYKKKAAEIFRNDMNKKYLFKPKINNRSKSIIKDKQSINNSCIDEVYERLFNDYEEHKERQKLRNEESLPSFKPKISKNSSTKNLFCNLKAPCRCGTNPVINFRNNTIIKKKYSINSKTPIVNNKNPKAKSEKLFSELYNNNIVEKYLNTCQSGNKKQMINKTQGPTQPTNNTHSNANYTEMNTDLINSKYIILENPFISPNNQNNKNKAKSKIPFLPQNIKKMIEKKCNEEAEESEERKNNNITNEINNQKIKNNNFFNTNKISEKNYEEEPSNINESNYDNEESNIKNNLKEHEENEDEDYYNVDVEQNDEKIEKKLPNINSKKDLGILEKLNDLEKTKKFYGQSQNETINSEDSKLTENNLYKLNIRDTTPHLIRQDVILASKDFSDFFDIPDMDDDF